MAWDVWMATMQLRQERRDEARRRAREECLATQEDRSEDLLYAWQDGRYFISASTRTRRRRSDAAIFLSHHFGASEKLGGFGGSACNRHSVGWFYHG